MEPFIHTYLYLGHVRTRPRSQEWASVCLTTNVSTSSIYLIINVRGDVVFTMAAQCIITIMRYNCRHDPSVLAVVPSAHCAVITYWRVRFRFHQTSNFCNQTLRLISSSSCVYWALGTFIHEFMYTFQLNLSNQSNVVCHESKISSLLPASYHQTISVVLPAAGSWPQHSSHKLLGCLIRFIADYELRLREGQ